MKRVYILLIALGLAMLSSSLAAFILWISDAGGTLERIGEIFGGQWPGGIIQFFTYLAFWYGILEIISIDTMIRRESLAYELRLLPTTEQYVLSAQDVNNIKLKVLKEEKIETYLLTDLIKKACTKFRANKSVPEMMDVVAAQVRINQNRSESGQSMIRYSAWVIPSVGFIGTIIGIASSMGSVRAEMSPEDLNAVTDALKVAFDTTLLSLLLSVILMFCYHLVQEQVERFHSDMENYVLENLVNRIYK